MKHCHFCQQPIEGAFVIQREGQEYCCSGCSTAESMLNGSQALAPSPKLIQKYAHFQAATEKEGYVQFNSTHAQWEVQLPNIHCTSCLILLERMGEWLDGIHEVRVQFSSKTAIISFNPSELTISVLGSWLDFIGYPPSIITKKERNRSELAKLGIAGFAMGNAMMSAFPEYFGLTEMGNAALLLFFRWSTAFFASVSLLVAGRFYIENAFKALRSAQWSLDIPIAVGMMSLWGWSAWLLISGISGGYFDSLSGLIFFLLLGKFLQEKTYAAFSFERSIEDFLPISVFSEDRGEYIRLAALVEGERINIPTGTVVPVLSEAVMEGSLDYSFVTGESIPQKIKEGSTVYPGATNVGGTLVALVMDSPKSAQIEGLWKEDVTETTGWVEERTTAIFTITVLILALAGGILWYFEVPERALEIAVSVLIIACPCALSLAAPFAYGTASGVLAKSGLFLKSAIGIETLAAVRKVYWDKTGTLTHQPKSEQLSFLTEQQMQAVKAIVARSTHPIAQSILSQLAEVQPATLMHWQEHVGLGLEGVGEDGKLYKIGSGKWLGLPEGPTYFLEDNLHLGSYEPNWGYRQITQMLLELRNRGLQNHLISGDSPRELPVEWKEVFMERVHFNCTPIQKSSLIDPKEASLYIGDGLNDVEAMASATIGLSIVDGELGYFPKSDGVIDAKLLHKLPFMLSYSKRMVRLVHNAYFFSLLYNLLGVAFALLGWLTPVIAAILMPLSSISVVLFSVIGARMMAAKS